MNMRIANRTRRAGAVSIIALAAGLGLPGGALADPAPPADEVAALHSLVDDLQRRVHELERQLAARRPPPAPSAAPPPAPARPAAPVRAVVPAPVPRAAPGPGTVDVDELAAERALERTLTAEGALLVAPGRFDVEPYFTYSRRENDHPVLIPVLVSGAVGIAARTAEVRRNEYDAGVRVRAGLPFSSQLELDVPYRWVDQSLIQPVGLSGTDESDAAGSSIGDIRIGVAKTLLHERGWRPDLVGRITWDTGTGDRSDNGVPLGIGFNELRLGLSALKRQDPLAFTAAVFYEFSFEQDDVKPGDEWALSLGASLAASPDTSLSFALVQSFTEELEIDGRRVEGSDSVSTMLAVGASSILRRNTLLALTVGIGLTDDAPDYSVNLSLPIRF